ncbi:MAG: pilus assembly protein PilM [Phycisphaerales bacterium]|nr:pilus assembly protein PilM [Phycisphaerales bacterium]
MMRRSDRPKLGPIAIDMGSRHLRMLQLAGTPAGLRVHAAAALPMGGLKAGERDAAPALSANVPLIADTLRENGFAGRRVVFALRPGLVRIKNFRLPPMTDEELAKAVRFEAAERFQTLDDRPEIRFLSAGHVDTADGEMLELIVMAARHDLLKDLLDATLRARLEVVGVELGPLAMFRSFERFLQRDSDAEQVNAFVDLGFLGTRIVLTRGAEVMLLKGVDLGARNMLDAIADRCGVDALRAEELYLAAAATDDPGRANQMSETTPRQVYEVIEPLVQQIGREVALCLKYASVTFKGAHSSTVTCVGGLAADDKILGWLCSMLGLPAKAGHPFRGIDPAPHQRGKSGGGLAAPDRRAANGAWATALGLALHGFPLGHSVEQVVEEVAA